MFDADDDDDDDDDDDADFNPPDDIKIKFMSLPISIHRPEGVADVFHHS